MSGEGPLEHQSGVNREGEPFVQLILRGEIIGQFTPAQARDHARVMHEAAEAAEQDAFIMFFFQAHIGLDKPEAAKILMEFRRYRDITTAKRGGPSDPKDWIFPKGEKPT